MYEYCCPLHGILRVKKGFKISPLSNLRFLEIWIFLLLNIWIFENGIVSKIWILGEKSNYLWMCKGLKWYYQVPNSKMRIKNNKNMNLHWLTHDNAASRLAKNTSSFHRPISDFLDRHTYNTEMHRPFYLFPCQNANDSKYSNGHSKTRLLHCLFSLKPDIVKEPKVSMIIC